MASNITVRGLDDDANRTANGLLDQLAAKSTRNLLRASYYDGKRAVRAVTRIMPPQYHRLGLTLGWAAKGVDLLVRRCNLTGFVWPGGDLDSLGYSEVWDGNMLGSEVDQGLVSSAIHATAFVVTTKGDTDAGEPPAVIHFVSAMDATGTWDSRARRLRDLIIVTGRDGSEVTAFTLHLPNRQIRAAKESRGWRVIADDPHSFGVPADPLVYRPRVGRPFGSSRITRSAMALQDEGVRAVLRGMGHMDVYAYPEFWMLGADERIFKNADGSPKPSWQVMLGRIKGIPDDDDAANPRADVKHIPAASPDPHMAWLNTTAKMFARELSLPDTALAITDVSNPTSAESYDASQYELIAEAEGATDDWSVPMRRSMARSLAMANDMDEVPAAWASIDSVWRDPRYLSRSAQADAGQKQLAAVPWLADSEVGLELLGLNPQQIRRALADKRRMGGSTALAGILERAAAARTGAPAVAGSVLPGADTTPGGTTPPGDAGAR